MQVPQRPGLARALMIVSLLAVGLFAGLGIGGPLVGAGVFAATDEMVTNSPYRDAGLADSPVQNTYSDDTYDTIIPNTLLFADALRRGAISHGEIAQWNPYILGGVPLGATPNFALASPLTIPYYVLPGWLAPAYVKLLEIAVAVGGCFLFLRRVGLGRPAALVGGLVFVSSAFQVAWTNWPQTRTAAVIPFVFWAVERLVRHRRVRDIRFGDIVALSLAVAAMLFGGFPVITGYTLLLAGAYLLVRTVAAHGPGRWWRDVRVLAAGVLGVLGGFALAAVQLLPFVSFLSGSLAEGRGQNPADHLPHEALITAIAPFALGTVDAARPAAFALRVNLVEALSYVGAAALVLAVIAVARPRAGRSLLPPGLWSFLVVSVLLGGVVIYAGGRPLEALQQLPVLFSDNAVGRARSVLGFLLAVLAAVGFDGLLRRPASPASGGRRWAGIGYGAVVWAAFVALSIWVWRDAGRIVNAARGGGTGRVAFFDHNVWMGLIFLGAALVCA
ncbi:MAG: hypothetical protein LC799_06770, partial [Actinobacteria bacterium]|nr:hypothetical protein [Actinomycetota bacterium]